MEARTGPAAGGHASHVLEVLWVATRLGLTSFGGPIAHLGYFREEYVVRRKWLDEATYADLVALCQFLPGPASSQVGIAIGVARAGLLGGLSAWLGFTLPSAIALVAFAYGIQVLGVADTGWLHGLKVAAVAVVALAVWGMARALAPDRERATIALLSAIGAVLWPTGIGQVTIIVVGALVGLRFLPGAAAPASTQAPPPVGRRLGTAALVLFFGLLAALPIARQLVPSHAVAVFESFFRAGSLVFGGGHVVLPLLQAEVVPPGWVTGEQFVAGYGAAQAVPGPLFTFAAYLGAVMGPAPNGVVGAALALGAVFLPSFLLVIGALPFWDTLRRRSGFQAALRGINAAVVGLLLAALYQPVWTSAIRAPADVALALAAFGMLAFWKAPAWLVVVLTAGGGAILSLAGR
ncbi:MAG: chromate efflux transporter [Candidatus Rokubacteria bacterium]|nr:chromate efflux transporter [Candidatus Rokubacteria bacterium]